MSVTDITWVMVITWSKVLPRSYYSSMYDSVSEDSPAHSNTVSVVNTKAALYEHSQTYINIVRVV